MDVDYIFRDILYLCIINIVFLVIFSRPGYQAFAPLGYQQF